MTVVALTFLLTIPGGSLAPSQGASGAPVGPVPPAHGEAGPAASDGVARADVSPLAPRNWTLWNITDPTARVWEAMAYDPADGYLLMFGGDVENYSTLLAPSNDTWEYRNQTWTEVCSGTKAVPVCPVSPPAGPASMTYDPAEGYVLLVDTNGDSWAYRAGLWQELNATGTPAICYGSSDCGESAAPMTYDPRTGQVVLLSPSGRTWAFANGSWADLGADTTAGIGYQDVLYFDPAYSTLVYVDGSATEAYLYNGSAAWTPLSLGPASGTRPPGFTPSCASSSYMGAGAYDPTLGGVVAVYFSSCYTTGTTWVLKDGSWSNATSQVGPTPPAGDWRAMAYDDADNYSVLFDGENVSASGPEEFNQTWSLLDPLNTSVTATPTNLEVGQDLTLLWRAVGGLRPYSTQLTGLPQGCAVPGNGISEACAPTTAGNYAVQVNVTDPAINESVSAVTPVTVFPGLSATAQVSATATTAGYPISFSSSIAGGRPPYSPRWTFGDGTSSAAQNASHDYGAPGTFVANFSVTDALGVTVAYTSIRVTVNGPLVLSATANRTVVDAGMSVAFSADPHVGTPPYSANWSFGDGSAGANGLGVSHTFGRSGSYSVVANVSDAVGDTQDRTIVITVNPILTAEVAVNESAPRNGTYVTFTAAAVGGTAPFSYRWTFGDGSHGGINGSSPAEAFSHRYLNPGNYSVELVVTDALGAVGEGSLNVSVRAPTNGNGSAPPTPGPALSELELVGLVAGAGLAVVAAAAIVVVLRRRHPKNRGPPSATGSVPPE